MKHCFPSKAGWFAALALLTASAQAEDLMLRLNADASSGSSSIAITHAVRGSFAQHVDTAPAKDGDLVVIGRDAAGAELFRRAIGNPARKQAEIFDAKTGQIQLSKPLTAKGAIELRMPHPANLASVEVSEYISRNGISALSSTPARKLSRKELDALVQQTAQASLVASAVPTGSAMLWESGTTAKRMDIVIIGDGFTKAETSTWQAAAKKVSDGVLADPLFAKFKNSMNIRRIDIESAQSGVTEGGVTRNSALGSEVGCFGIDRLVCTDEAKVLTAVGAIAPTDGRDVIIVLVNSSTYAGAASGNIGGFSLHPQSIEIALHEIGHAAFQLADEYDYGTCDTSSEPTAANVTRVSSRANVKWASLIAAATPVPTSPGSVANGTVGIFQGADYCSSGKYRPTETSRMRALSNPWHAVNEARAKRVFDSYTGGSTDTAPAISSQPASQTVTAGQSATFSVAASGGNLSYQWRKNGTAISGATAASYTTPATTTADNGAQYSVVISNGAGSVTSSAATLTVKSSDVNVPVISSQPASVTVKAGATASFSVSATGSAPLSYQWRKNGTAIAGATAASYTTPATTAADNGAQFSVVVSNSAGSVTSGNATLTVTSDSSGGTTVKGTIASGASLTYPSGSPGYYQSTVGGSFSAKLSGPAGTDFDLYLYKWNGSNWAVVAKSEGPASTESFNYNGSAGYYYLELKSYSGSGAFTLNYSFAK
ncbi:M64 family metallopeptidase [Paucibacter sp. APW11]|uniref:M64 family metallopeptidase n=1 Tax=Roseateles aquae TaxID=3077235 RepID=A0ABU3P8Q4_9BURK|nr:M64 family metallopeptidase [Paucibacter sp. APW11]MDT8998945.1 M64 family metallopeptidase [Paucibacter sp. APW11]